MEDVLHPRTWRTFVVVVGEESCCARNHSDNVAMESCCTHNHLIMWRWIVLSRNHLRFCHVDGVCCCPWPYPPWSWQRRAKGKSNTNFIFDKVYASQRIQDYVRQKTTEHQTFCMAGCNGSTSPARLADFCFPVFFLIVLLYISLYFFFIFFCSPFFLQLLLY